MLPFEITVWKLLKYDANILNIFVSIESVKQLIRNLFRTIIRFKSNYPIVFELPNIGLLAPKSFDFLAKKAFLKVLPTNAA